MCTVKGGKNGSNNFGKGGERFPQLFTPPKAGFGGSGGDPWTSSGQG